MVDRRHFLTGAAAMTLGVTAARAQHTDHRVAPLPQAAPSADPFANLRSGAPHHITPTKRRSASRTVRRHPARQAAG
jgi:hypothetical protein